MRKLKLLFICCLLIITHLLSASPKEEFRAVWLTTVWGSDWPSSYTVSTQQSQLTQILDSLQAWNFNAVMFQVRPACDAFYSSSIEPWSNWLTGAEGTAPSPLYDPLQFLIDEAEERGIEVHAWFNPYRAKTGNAGTSLTHVYNTHPEWVLTVGSSPVPAFSKSRIEEKTFLPASEATQSTTYILDPGMQDVRDYVLSVVADVATRYDIDGVHLDDYFYPYSGMNGEDAATYSSESRGFTDIADWRRDNINLLIEAIHDTLQIIDPRIKFGVSPFGIWKNGVPDGIIGTSAYDAIYCDALTWIQGQWVDYIAPQLYWPFGGGQDYGLLMPWWAGQVDDHTRHLYVGHGAYKIVDWSEDEIPDQVSLNRETNSSLGSIYFSYSDIADNPKGSLDSLKNNYYKYLAVPPHMNWKDSLSAPAPKNVQSSLSGNDIILSWGAGDITAAHDDAADRYLVYKWPTSGSFDANDASQIAAIIPASETLSYTDSDHDTYSFGIAAQDQLSNESAMVMAEGDHDLDLDFENDSDVGNWNPLKEDLTNWLTECTWSSSGGVSNSGALNFTDAGWGFFIRRPLTADSQSAYTLTLDVKTAAWTHTTNTLKAYVTGLSTIEPQATVSTYSSYTQISLSGLADAGTSGYIRFEGISNGNPSSLWIDNLSFTVEAPGTPTPITLAFFTAEAKNGVVELAWETATETNNARFVIYRNDVAIASVAGAGTTSEPHEYSFVDDAVVPGVAYTYVLADVDLGNNETKYTDEAVTVTVANDLVEADFVVGAAYPNPFNPSTVVPVELTRDAMVKASLYDLNGREVKALINANFTAGSHELRIDGAGLTTGLYLVQVVVDNVVDVQKIALMK